MNTLLSFLTRYRSALTLSGLALAALTLLPELAYAQDGLGVESAFNNVTTGVVKPVVTIARIAGALIAVGFALMSLFKAVQTASGAEAGKAIAAIFVAVIIYDPTILIGFFNNSLNLENYGLGQGFDF